MKTAIIKGLDEQKAEEVEANFKSSALFRERLGELILEKIASKRNKVRQEDMYNSPSWALIQADAVGYERGLYEIISLISS